MPDAPNKRRHNGGKPGRMSWAVNHLLGNGVALGSVVLCIGFVLVALLAPIIAPHSPSVPHLLNRLQPPFWLDKGSMEFPLGTDQLGRDILSRLIFGSRLALLVSSLAVVLSGIIGLILGLVSGYFGGWADSLISRVLDMLLSIPNIVLYLAILSVFGPSLTLLVLVIGFVNWTTFARVVRAEVLSVKEREYIQAASALGQRRLAIITKHVLPNVLAPFIIMATLNVAFIVILESSLSFLGFGVQPPSVTWGSMLADGRDYIATSWWLAAFPGILITLLCLSLILLGDWLRDVLDPRTRGGA